jgi:peptidoglycan hydrolase CwlO-like protein
MVLLGVALLSLLYRLTKDLTVITTNIVAMSGYTQSISENIQSMKGTMLEIKSDMGDMNKTITQLSTETGRCEPVCKIWMNQ